MGSPAGSPGEAERPSGGGEVRVHEEVLKAGVGQMFLDASPHSGAGRGGPGLPRSPRPIRALRQPASLGGSAEEAPVFRNTDRELEPDTFVAREQREIAVRGRRADDLDAARRLECAERRDEILVDGVKQIAKPGQPIPPEFHQRQQMVLTGGGQRGRALRRRP